MNKHKVKHHRNSDNKKGNREPHQDHRPETVSYELLVSLIQINDPTHAP